MTGQRVRALRRVVAGAALLGLIASLNAPAALAQTSGSDNQGIWSRLMKSVGVNSTPEPNSDINYIERPPLVVPPSRDLPPPVADPAAPAANWPSGTAKTIKHAKSKTEVIPATAVQNPNSPYEKKPWYNPMGWFSKKNTAPLPANRFARILPSRRQATGYRRPSSRTASARIKRASRPHRT